YPSLGAAIPLLTQEGWLRHQEKRCEATAAAQTGWSGLKKCFRMRSLKEAPTIDHPVRSVKGGFATFVDVAATPPVSGGVNPSCIRRGVARRPIHSHLL